MIDFECCQKCGVIYNRNFPVSENKICTCCGAKIIKREEQKQEIERLRGALKESQSLCLASLRLNIAGAYKTNSEMVLKITTEALEGVE